jgi:hypothetical protein
LGLDKKDPSRKFAKKYEALIEARLVEGSLVLAELYRRQVGWQFDGNRFYFMAGEPEYIPPAEGATAAKK